MDGVEINGIAHQALWDLLKEPNPAACTTECKPLADLFILCGLVQGDLLVKVIKVTPPGVVPPSTVDYNRFLVRKYQWDGNLPKKITLPTAVTDSVQPLIGTAGMGNPNPISCFKAHVIGLFFIGNTPHVYDSSYGGGRHLTVGSFQDTFWGIGAKAAAPSFNVEELPAGSSSVFIYVSL